MTITQTSRWTTAGALALGDVTVAYGTVTQLALVGGRVQLAFDSNHSASVPFSHKLAVWA